MLLVVAGFAVLLVVVVGTGLWVLTHQPTTVSDLTSSASPSAIVSQTISPSPSPVTAGPLTADLAGDYCPVAHRGDSACWKGAAINTGPPIGKLALIFILGAPYANWFANHSSAALSGFYTSPGCEIDAPQVRILCGSVGPGQEVDVYLGGDVSKRGTFTYAVKFADVSSGSPVYINEHPDGTHDIVTWREVIS